MTTKIEEDYEEFLKWYEFMTKGDEDTFWDDFDAHANEAEERGW